MFLNNSQFTVKVRRVIRINQSTHTHTHTHTHTLFIFIVVRALLGGHSDAMRSLHSIFMAVTWSGRSAGTAYRA